jgi:hypothetical protein
MFQERAKSAASLLLEVPRKVKSVASRAWRTASGKEKSVASKTLSNFQEQVKRLAS